MYTRYQLKNIMTHETTINSHLKVLGLTFPWWAKVTFTENKNNSHNWKKYPIRNRRSGRRRIITWVNFVCFFWHMNWTLKMSTILFCTLEVFLILSFSGRFGIYCTVIESIIHFQWNKIIPKWVKISFWGRKKHYSFMIKTHYICSIKMPCVGGRLRENV